MRDSVDKAEIEIPVKSRKMRGRDREVHAELDLAGWGRHEEDRER